MNRKWTAEEMDFLKDNIGKQRIETIAHKLRRTETAIFLKAKRLKIANTKQIQGNYSLGELATLIHINRRTLYNWVQKGLFPAHKKITKQKRSFYFVKPNEFWKWAFENKEKLNFSNISPFSILPEPKWVDKERKKDDPFEEMNYKYWTVGEIRNLLEYYHQGYNCAKIADKLNRTPHSIRNQLKRNKHDI